MKMMLAIGKIGRGNLEFEEQFSYILGRQNRVELAEEAETLTTVRRCAALDRLSQ